MVDWPSDGGRPTLRHDVQEAASVVEQLLPDTTFRRWALEQMIELIRHAAAAEPASWSVTLFKRRVRLNVARSWGMDIGPGGVRLVLDATDLGDELDSPLQRIRICFVELRRDLRAERELLVAELAKLVMQPLASC